MKHLYSLVFAFIALTGFNLSTAQNIVTTNATTPISCDGTANFSDAGNFSNCTWTWYAEDTTTFIPSSGQSISNLCAGDYYLQIDSAGFTQTVSFTIYDICSNIAVSGSVTNVTTPGNCDGIIQITGSGGSAPYAYTFDGGPQQASGNVSNVCAGTYTITAMDGNGCTASANVTVNDPCSNIAVSTSVTNCTPGNCDGTLQFAVTGASGSYTYTVSGGVQMGQLPIPNLCPGTYTVTVVDANGCSAVATATVNDPCSNFTGTISSTTTSGPAMCDGTASFNPMNGTAPYTYLWSNGMTTQSAFNLCIGTLSVMCEDANGCTVTQSVTISDSLVTIGSLSANLSSTDDLTNNCSGSASVAPTGGVGPYYYSWSNGATTSSISNLCVGNYSVMVWNTTDTVTVNFTIQNTQNPCANFTGTTSAIFASNPVSCDGSASVTPVNGTAPYNYVWSNGLTTQSIANLCTGTYTVTLEDSNGCGVTLTVFVYDSIGTISNLTANLNTADDYTGNCDGSASITPTGGIAPYSVLWSNGQGGGSISNLCAGIYSVTIWDSGSDSTTVNFIIADSSTTYGNNPFPNVTINDTLYTELVTNCTIDYSTIDSASLYQAVYDTINQNLYVTWAVYSPTDTVYISDTLGLAGLPPGYYGLTISVYCPNKSGSDFFKIESVIYFDGTNVWMSTLGVDEHVLDHVSIYPNPFIHSISIDNKDGVIQSMKLVDLNGRILSEMPSVNSGMVKMDQLESISSGTYLLILSGANSSKAYKVIK
jgi:hypothetical protein